MDHVETFRPWWSLSVNSTFMCRTAEDDGIYRSVTNHQLFTTQLDTELAIYDIVKVAARGAV